MLSHCKSHRANDSEVVSGSCGNGRRCYSRVAHAVSTTVLYVEAKLTRECRAGKGHRSQTWTPVSGGLRAVALCYSQDVKQRIRVLGDPAFPLVAPSTKLPPSNYNTIRFVLQNATKYCGMRVKKKSPPHFLMLHSLHRYVSCVVMSHAALYY